MARSFRVEKAKRLAFTGYYRLTVFAIGLKVFVKNSNSGASCFIACPRITNKKQWDEKHFPLS